MNTCHICSTPVDDTEPGALCAGCGEPACPNCNIGGLCLHCLTQLELLYQER